MAPVAILRRPTAAAARSYYVAPNGNDSAAGTQAAPWASIARAQTVAQPGDTVYFRGGTYAYTRANSSLFEPDRPGRRDHPEQERQLGQPDPLLGLSRASGRSSTSPG